MRWHIHNLVTQRKELSGRQYLREKIRIIRICTNERDADKVVLDAFAHEEVATSYMLHATKGY